MEDVNGRVRRIAADRESGASELRDEVLEVLREALVKGLPLVGLAKALIEAQPSMAPVWNAVGQALEARTDPAAFERYVLQVRRAPRALVRHLVNLLTDDDATPLTLVTISSSSTVLLGIQSLAETRHVRVACADGHPTLEGRQLALRLASSGVPVTHHADAALAHALAGADAVLVGADAVAPGWFLNKSGTRMLAAAAAIQGVPVYVLATRDKLVTEAVAERLVIREGPPDEIWPSPPSGVTVRNPYFERTPLDLVSAIVTDMGVLGASLLPDACAAMNDAVLLSLDL